LQDLAESGYRIENLTAGMQQDLARSGEICQNMGYLARFCQILPDLAKSGTQI